MYRGQAKAPPPPPPESDEEEELAPGQLIERILQRPTPSDTASEIAQELVEELEEPTLKCPNCDQMHFEGTLVCYACNQILSDEAPDWSADDPVLAGQSHEYEPGANAVIDQLVNTGDPSVSVNAQGNYVATPEAAAKASNIVNLRAANLANARHRVAFVTDQRQTHPGKILVSSSRVLGRSR